MVLSATAGAFLFSGPITGAILMMQTCENELGEVEACFNYAPELFDAQTMER